MFFDFKLVNTQAIVVHTFNPSTGKAAAAGGSLFEASLACRASSRAARATERTTILKNQDQNKTVNGCI